jgi:hypothetical protein
MSRRRKPVNLIRGNAADQTFQIDHLIDAGRATDAFNGLAIASNGAPTDALLRLFDATMRQIAKAQAAEEIGRLGVGSHNFQRFLDKLRSRCDATQDDIARREYQALPLLGALNARNLTLHTFMAENPAFFVDVLCEVYLPSSRDKDHDLEPTSQERGRARTAYRLLEGMDKIPGTAENGALDEVKLIEWIKEVRKLAAEKDRAVLADIKIGSVLAHAPNDPEDAAWPHRAVRGVIEGVDSKDIEHGLIVERYNMRGPYSKAFYEGGAKERELAALYRGWVNNARPQWPRMASVLDEIVKGWEKHGHREDLRAEQQKLE